MSSSTTRVRSRRESLQQQPRRASTTTISKAGISQPEQEDDDAEPLLESMQELIEKEKVLLEYQVVEREERLKHLEEQYQALEAQVKQRQASRQVSVRRTGSATGPPRDFITGTTMALTGVGLNARRLLVVLKQCKLLKKQGLQVLRLDRNDLGDDCTPLLMELLAIKPPAVLDLAYNNLGPKSISALLAAIPKSKELSEKLQLLCLQGNAEMAGTKGLGATLARVFKELYEKNGLKNLWGLSLTLNDFGAISQSQEEEERRPALSIRKGKAVKGKNPMNAMAFISSFLRKTKAKLPLVSLELKHASLSHKTMAVLSQTACLSSLTRLDLSDSFIGPQGVQSLSKSIKAKKDVLPLISLGLRGNLMGDYGATVLAEALAQRTNITDLDVASNCLNDAGAISLGQALIPRGTLVSLNMARNRLTGTSIRKLVELVRLPTCAVLTLDVSGSTCAILLKAELEKRLEQQRGQFYGERKPRKPLVSWRKGVTVREAFRNSSPDGYVRVWSYEVPRDAFDDLVITAPSNGKKHITNLIEATWALSLVGGTSDETKLSGGRFLWKLCRERMGEVVVVKAGRRENYSKIVRAQPPSKSSASRGEGEADHLPSSYLRFDATAHDCLPGDKLMLCVAAADQHYIMFPRTSLAEAGDVMCQRLCIDAIVDDSYGLLYKNDTPCYAAEHHVPDYNLATTAAAYTLKDESETWKLVILLGDGHYTRMHDMFVGVGGNIMVSWEGQVEDREDGGGVPFVWALIQRRFGKSTIVAHGDVSDQRLEQASADEGWAAEEVTVTCCFPGDVLVIWLGILEQKQQQQQIGYEEKVNHHQQQLCRQFCPKIRNVKIFQDKPAGGGWDDGYQEEATRKKRGGQQASSVVPIPWASGYPTSVGSHIFQGGWYHLSS